MMQAVSNFLTQNTTQTTSIPEIATHTTTLQAHINTILQNYAIQDNDNTGITLEKNNTITSIISTALTIIDQLIPYSVVINDLELRNQINFTKSELTRAADNLLLERATKVHDTASLLATELAPYGITPQTITDLQLLLTQFQTQITQPQITKGQRAVATLNIKTTFNIANQLLKNQLDQLMTSFRHTNPNLYNSYRNVRKIINTGQHETSIKGKILDAALQVPVSNAQIKLLELNITKKTTQTGGYTFKSILPGNYTLAILHPQYTTKIITNIPVLNQKTHILDILMPKNNSNIHYNNLTTYSIPANGTLTPSLGLLTATSHVKGVNIGTTSIKISASTSLNIPHPTNFKLLNPGEEFDLTLLEIGDQTSKYLILQNLSTTTPATVSVAPGILQLIP